MFYPSSILDKVNVRYEVFRDSANCFHRIGVFDEESFLEYYLGLMDCYRKYHSMEYIRAYTFYYVAKYLSKYMYSIYVNYDVAKRYGMNLVNKIKNYAENNYIEIEEVKKTVIDVCNKMLDLINTGEFLSYVDPETMPGVKWAKQNIVIRKCRKCGQEFMSLTDEAIIYLLVVHNVLIPREWIEYCPKCTRRKKFFYIIRSNYRKLKHYKNYRYYRREYRKYYDIQEEGKKIYPLEYDNFYNKVKKYPSFYIEDLITVLEASEQSKDDFIKMYGNVRLFYKLKYLYGELSHRGPLTIDELAKILADKLGIRETSIKRWINKKFFNKDSSTILIVLEKHGKTVKVDLSPLFVLYRIIEYLESDVPRILCLDDIYSYLRRHNRRHLIPIINTIYELRYYGTLGIYLYDYLNNIYKHIRDVGETSKSKGIGTITEWWRLFDETVYKILFDFIQRTFWSDSGIKIINIEGLDLKYIVYKLRIAYQQNKGDTTFLKFLNKVIKSIYDYIIHYYNESQELKKELETLINSTIKN